MPAWMAQHVAASAGINGVDLDATSTIGAWLVSRMSTDQPPYVRVRTVWIPHRGFQSPHIRRLVDSLMAQQLESPPTVVAVVPSSSSLRALTRELEPIRTMAEVWPLAIGFSSASLRGGRPHLVQLGGLRRFAEEWDLSLAIDLSGNFDPTWEAEAAIARLGARLTILRLRSSAPSRAAVGQDRVACRALHAAVDRGHPIEIAICAAKMFPLPTTPKSAAFSARSAIDYIAERAAIRAEALREGIDHFEGSRSSLGN